MRRGLRKTSSLLLPALPAVCLIEPREEKAEPFLIRTQNLQRRLQRLLGPVDPASKRLNLSEFAHGIRYRLTGSPFEQTLTYYQHAKQVFPKRYPDRLRMRPAAVLKVNLRNAYPRCYVTRHISMDQDGLPTAGAYYGPFASRRSAEAFAERVLDFFKVRRCQIKIRRDPTFPGCIYSEMKMCLAPCFAGCTKEEYDVEVQRLVQFLETSGGSLRAAIEQERERASEELDFERAAAVHKRIEKLDDALRGQARTGAAHPGPGRGDPATHRGRPNDWSLRRSRRAGSPNLRFVRFAEIAGQPRSAEQIFREYLEPAAEAAPRAGDLGEHLWLVARWYYSNPREGEIFFREKDWPYRRILRACSRLLAPKARRGRIPRKRGACEIRQRSIMSTSATKDGTAHYAQRFSGRAADGHFREAHGLVLSSLGIGTYLGPPDDKTDSGYTAAVVAAVESGINVIDAAINYRFQRSERSIGASIKRTRTKGFPREEFVLCTKGGYLTPDGAMPADPNEYFFREYIQPGIFSAERHRRGQPLHDATVSGKPDGTQPAAIWASNASTSITCTIRRRSSARCRGQTFSNACVTPSRIWNRQWQRGRFSSTAWPRGTVFVRKRGRATRCSLGEIAQLAQTLRVTLTISASCSFRSTWR